MSTMRRAVAAKVAQSFATVPHFYLRSEADVTSLVQFRAQNIDAYEKCCGLRPTVTDFLLRAMILALRDCPQANCIWHDDAILSLPDVDVGLVVQVGDGLQVPVLHRADRLGLADLVRRRVALTDAVRSGKTSTDMFQGGATALTNLGKRRVDAFAPIISPPQSSMLAVGRVAERPWAVEGCLCLRHTMYLTLAVDHRVMDGVPAAEFLDRIVDYLEHPFVLLCDSRHPIQ
jgi:pyruvate dehydrogenase E2 component (dihydrolipoamide acetyltransferase)